MGRILREDMENRVIVKAMQKGLGKPKPEQGCNCEFCKGIFEIN